MSQDYTEGASGTESGVTLEDELKEPAMYRVLLHNDDYTTMDFVVKILEEVFHKTQEESVAIMMSVHQKGMGVCGVYPKEIAEFRVTQVATRARHARVPPALHHGKGIALETAVACCGRRFSSVPGRALCARKSPASLKAPVTAEARPKKDGST